MHAWYADHFVLPLPDSHRFPMDKYRRLRERVAAELPGVVLSEPAAATDSELCRAHDPAYVARVSRGDLSVQEIRIVGFPWSAQMIERSRRSAGATMAACRAALRDGVSVNLAGGTHHAKRASGAGYCVFNDAAVATRMLQSECGIGRVAIVDLDVHQGDGTAEILGGDDSVFTLSLHGDHNFPFRKEMSHLDVALPDGTADDAYLAALDDALVTMNRRFDPQFVIYLAGADPFEGDRLGRLKLTKRGLAERDRRIFDLCRARGLPLAVTMAGGYAEDIGDIVDIHFATVEAAERHGMRRP
ncbi:MAG: histone deacetylase [Gammaproteobacteria bacterium]|jgi:acetoin utilization deacetylase AcuC-like enzyme|nr:histone deacetylase [Gammaproteobacteria bacterium]MBU0770922.1 histone deacetylase [Gammaproteobacteria bacterium]MBU0856796.1 histone deacetylase [Gammaproteobacteria bacterium]MBU1845522.1 histone deacetylase [Gammaproteobacteria bacterium]